MREDSSIGEVVPLVENEDYYLDQGLMVLTARYHLRRGYCCEHGCRHCPYTELLQRSTQTEVDDDEDIK
jgi:hypothetical protein